MPITQTGHTDILVTAPAPHVAQITLNRPKAYNALCTNLLKELSETLHEAAGDSGIRAVILTGGPKVFAAGADIMELAAHDEDSIKQDIRPNYWQAVRDFPKPLIAAVNGYCLGGGNELAMHADIIIAGHKAEFGQPEINLGIIPGAGGTQRLLHAVGKSRAMQMVLTGTYLNAKDACALGLVSEVVQAELCIERAQEIASLIASKPPIAVQKAKHAISQAFEMPMKDALTLEREAFCSLFGTEDRLEGIAAFTEKRKPVFKGK